MSNPALSAVASVLSPVPNNCEKYKRKPQGISRYRHDWNHSRHVPVTAGVRSNHARLVPCPCLARHRHGPVWSTQERLVPAPGCHGSGTAPARHRHGTGTAPARHRHGTGPSLVEPCKTRACPCLARHRHRAVTAGFWSNLVRLVPARAGLCLARHRHRAVTAGFWSNLVRLVPARAGLCLARHRHGRVLVDTG